MQPADGTQIPFTAAGRKLYEEHKAAAAKGDYSFDPTEMRCSSPGLPRVMLTPMLIRIFQRPQMVVMLFEWNRLLRQIDLARHPEAPDPNAFEIPTMKGKTTGSWEGNVLVAHSSAFSSARLLDNLLPNTEDLELTEHIRIKDHDTLEDRITIQDPDYFTRPWDAVLTYHRQPDALFPFAEDVCLERRKGGGLPL